jgi:hypothetical protein
MYLSIIPQLLSLPGKNDRAARWGGTAPRALRAKARQRKLIIRRRTFSVRQALQRQASRQIKNPVGAGFFIMLFIIVLRL